MKKLNKKGFTIVELVIVIAVIAILAAVLIPTFSNIIKKANVSKDTQLVRNLNTALATDKALNGEHDTMQDALDAAAEAGYDVAKINASATDNEILWDSVADAFCYYNAESTAANKIEYTPDVTGNTATNAVDLWKISATVDPTYSTYLYGYTDASTSSAPLVITKGLDVGNCSVAYLKYATTENQKIKIRTNSSDTEMTINAENSTVYHYDQVGNVTIKAVAMASYDEAGRIGGTCVIEKGHINVLGNGYIGAIVVDTETENDVTLTTATENTVGMLFAKNETILNQVKASNSIAQTPEVADETKIAKIKTSTLYNKNTNTYYGSGDAESIKTAVNAASKGDVLVLIRDTEVKYESGSFLTISNDDEIVIDLNGHELFGKAIGGEQTYLIDNNGSLTIKDSTDVNKTGTGTGKIINYCQNTASGTNPKYGTSTVRNFGTLILESGTIESTSSGGASYAVDSYAHENGASIESIFTMNGGRLINTDGDAGIRIWAYSTSKMTKFVMNGGYIVSNNGGDSAVWVQNCGTTGQKVLANVQFNGGTVVSDGSVFDVGQSGTNFEGLTVNFNGTTFDGEAGFFRINGSTVTKAQLVNVSVASSYKCAEESKDGKLYWTLTK